MHIIGSVSSAFSAIFHYEYKGDNMTEYDIIHLKKRVKYYGRFLKGSDSPLVHKLLEVVEIIEHSETIEECREKLLTFDDNNDYQLTKLAILAGFSH